jgi:hypothetical protein
MPSDIVAILAVDVGVPKQRLNALVVAAEAAKEKATAACHRVLAARQLLDKEQAVAAYLKWQATAKKLVPDPRLPRPQRPRSLLRRTSTPSSPISTSRQIL